MKIVNLNGLSTPERLVVIEQTLNDIISNLYKDMIWSSYDDYTTNTKNYSMEQLAQFTDVSEVETGQMVYFAKQGVVALVGAINTQNKTFNVTDNYSIVGPKGDTGDTGPIALAQVKLVNVLSDPTGVTQLTLQKSIFNREPVVGDGVNVIVTYGTKAWQFSGTITKVNDNFCTFSHETAPAGYISIVGPKGAAGDTKYCHNIMFSKSVSQSEMIQCSFSIVDESPANYENLNFVYSALSGSHINAPQNHRFAATGFYMKNYICMPITSIRWSAATLRISYIDTTLEQPNQADYICTLSDSCTDCTS